MLLFYGSLVCHVSEELPHLGVLKHALAYPKNTRPEPRLGIGVREQRERFARDFAQVEIRRHHQHDIDVTRIGMGGDETSEYEKAHESLSLLGELVEMSKLCVGVDP